MSERLEAPRGEWLGPLPVADRETFSYWEALRRHEIEILRCGDCGRWIHYPLAACPACHSFNVVPESVAGPATIYSFTVVHREFVKGITPPYIVALVEFPAQPSFRTLTNIVNCRADQVSIGMSVNPVFFDATPDVTLLLFEPSMENDLAAN